MHLMVQRYKIFVIQTLDMLDQSQGLRRDGRSRYMVSPRLAADMCGKGGKIG